MSWLLELSYAHSLPAGYQRPVRFAELDVFCTYPVAESALAALQRSGERSIAPRLDDVYEMFAVPLFRFGYRAWFSIVMVRSDRLSSPSPSPNVSLSRY